jgi:hypothetical protein
MASREQRYQGGGGKLDLWYNFDIAIGIWKREANKCDISYILPWIGYYATI